MARPTIYAPEMLEKAAAYVDGCSGMGVHELLPTIEGLALALNVSKDTLYEWEKIEPEFSDVLKKLRESQAQKLIQNSLVGRYNPLITKLMLSKHGYIEKKEVDNNINGNVQFVNDVPRPPKST